MSGARLDLMRTSSRANYFELPLLMHHCPGDARDMISELEDEENPRHPQPCPSTLGEATVTSPFQSFVTSITSSVSIMLFVDSVLCTLRTMSGSSPHTQALELPAARHSHEAKAHHNHWQHMHSFHASFYLLSLRMHHVSCSSPPRV